MFYTDDADAVYNRAVAVGRAHAGEAVAVRLDPAAVAWVIQDAGGRTIAQRPSSVVPGRTYPAMRLDLGPAKAGPRPAQCRTSLP